MSSMRNAVQRRSHRERAQPLERQRLGLLEKDKDRQLRQKDYKKKQTTLRHLREKAAERNEDEFYFGMLSRDGPGSRLVQGKRWKGTVAGDRGNKAMRTDLVRLLKTQDVGYVRTMRSVAVREVERLREQVVLAAEGLPEDEDDDEDDEDDEFDFAAPPAVRPRKIVFVEEGEEAQKGVGGDDGGEEDEDEDEEEELDEDEATDNDKNDARNDDKDDELSRRRKNLQRLRAGLAAAEQKLKMLNAAERELEVQKAKMAKTATSGGQTRKGKKIMVRARKR